MGHGRRLATLVKPARSALNPGPQATSDEQPHASQDQGSSLDI